MTEIVDDSRCAFRVVAGDDESTTTPQKKLDGRARTYDDCSAAKEREAPAISARQEINRSPRAAMRPGIKARRARIPAVFERGATPSPGMQRRS